MPGDAPGGCWHAAQDVWHAGMCINYQLPVQLLCSRCVTCKDLRLTTGSVPPLPPCPSLPVSCCTRSRNIEPFPGRQYTEVKSAPTYNVADAAGRQMQRWFRYSSTICTVGNDLGLACGRISLLLIHKTKLAQGQDMHSRCCMQRTICDALDILCGIPVPAGCPRWLRTSPGSGPESDVHSFQPEHNYITSRTTIPV